MSFRPSQTAEYWTDQFQLTAEDVAVFVEQAQTRERPITTADLVQALVETRLQQEDQRIRRELARGRLYDPKENYEIGESLVFTALDYAVGTVIDRRPGRNPEHGDFEVLTVAWPDGAEPRRFAASFKTPHKLNLAAGAEAGILQAGQGAQALIDRFGPEIQTRLAAQLEAWDDPAFANLDRYWLPKDALADVHIGHMNIAEALIEVQGRPLTTAEILPDLDLPREIPGAISAFSLDLGLSDDERFADVGIESHEWYLDRLLPVEAMVTPRRLQPAHEAYERDLLTVPLLQMEWELDDEWTEDGVSSSTAQMPSIQLVLGYPHRRSGTLPLSTRTRGFFPVRAGKRSMITFVDGRWGKRFSGWVIPEGRYVAGLGDWYEEHSLPVGAFITLERTADPSEVVVDFRPRRPKREWVRMAGVEGDRLTFQLQKETIPCEYDPHMVLAEADPKAIDTLRRRLYRQKPSVYELLEQIAPALMGLSNQGTVHAKTLYSGINLLRRLPPGPVFAALIGSPRFSDAGDGFFGMARG